MARKIKMVNHIHPHNPVGSETEVIGWCIAFTRYVGGSFVVIHPDINEAIKTANEIFPGHNLTKRNLQLVRMTHVINYADTQRDARAKAKKSTKKART